MLNFRFVEDFGEMPLVVSQARLDPVLFKVLKGVFGLLIKHVLGINSSSLVLFVKIMHQIMCSEFK